MKKPFLLTLIPTCTHAAFAFSLPCERLNDEQKTSDIAQESIYVETYQRERIIPLLPLLNAWGSQEFSHYPYLFAAPEDQIVCPSDILFVNSKDSLVALARQEGKVLGMATMVSFDDPVLLSSYFDAVDPTLRVKIQAVGLDPSHMLYVAYFLTASECHNHPLVVDALYNTITQFAREKQKTHLCYMEDISVIDHSLQREEKYAIEPWEEVIEGFKNTGVSVNISWPTRLDSSVEKIEHTLEFFVRACL